MVMFYSGSVARAVTVTVSTATTCDNYYDLYIDGDYKFSTTFPGDGWNTPESWSEPLAAGQEHVVAVKGNNYEPWPGWNPAGFLGEIEPDPGNWFVGEDAAHTHLIVTDEQWKVYFVSHGSADEPPLDSQGRNWTAAGYDDSGWGSAYEIGPNGCDPWGFITGISGSAEWIWTETWGPDSGSVADTPVYFRRGFTPVPEPVTLLGVLLSVGGAAGYLRRRRKA